MNRIKSRLALLAGGALIAGGAATACSSQPVAYEPAAYGANGTCYYIQSPAEAYALQQAGLCPRGWGIGMAPLYWQEMYWPYYSSPAYYGVYVPSPLRTTYVSVERTFYNQHTSAVRTASSTASYRSSTGKTVTGKTVIASKAQFGSGKSFSTAAGQYGSGSLKSGSGTSARSVTGNPDTSGRSSSYRGSSSGRSSYGSGGLRSSSGRGR